MSFCFTVTLDYDDYRAANLLMFRRQWFWRGIAKFVLAVTPLWTLVAMIGDDWADPMRWLANALTSFAMASLIICATVLGFRLVIPRTLRKTWDHLHLDGLPTRHEFDGNAIVIGNDRGTSNLDFAMFTGWIEDQRSFMMFRTRRMFHLVPKAQVTPEDLAQLRSALTANGVPNR